jgi:glycosidase
MKTNSLQLMVYGSGLDDIEVNSNSKSLSIINTHLLKNNSYLFIDIKFSADALPGNYKLEFVKGGERESINYPLLKRKAGGHSGFSSEDAIYLIFPDRFVNGDTSNDTINNEIDSYDFYSLDGRHGGDIQGIINKLDYVKDLGFTAIWSTPVLLNNMYMSYHGYAATDLYIVDPRFGSNELYKTLVDEAHDRGLKVIYDHVANHIGINHEWVNNLPMDNWFNGTPENHQHNYHSKMSNFDIHSDSLFIVNAQTGWFTNYMPDLNQQNPFMANYIIQNTLWWIEYAGFDGIREDTYPYNNIKFMARWAEVILNEYPNFNIVGEVWKGQSSTLASFQGNSKLPNSAETNLPVITDFALRDALNNFLSGSSGIAAIYEVIAKDYLFSNPDNLLVFMDNHDIDRGMFNAGGNVNKFKLALTLLLTTRGIPQILYGTEIGINEGRHHGKIRKPFPGGFPADSINAFVSSGRSDKENEIFNHLQNLLHIRKDHKSVATGKLTHYPPINNIYVYFKEDELGKYFILLNGNESSQKFSTSIISYKFGKGSIMTELLSGETLQYREGINISLDGYSSKIYKID